MFLQIKYADDNSYFQMKGEKTNEINSRLKKIEVLVIRMLTEVGKGIHEHSENFNKKLGNNFKKSSSQS